MKNDLNWWNIVKILLRSTWILIQTGALAIVSVCVAWVICTVMPQTTWYRDLALGIICLVMVVYTGKLLFSINDKEITEDK